MAESFSGWYQNHGSYATDADFGGDPATYKSTSGYICILECEHANYVLDWFSRKQTAVSRSTTEAELCAAGHGATEGIWERLLLTELKMIQPCRLTIPITIQTDSQSAKALAEGSDYTGGLRHVAVQFRSRPIRSRLVEFEWIRHNPSNCSERGLAESEMR